MGQEFQIKSSTLEAKVRELLPSQGGYGAGFDLSASTQIIPIVDLTESAEGSNLRQDLQTSIGFDLTTTFSVTNATTTTAITTGYWRVFGNITTLNTSNRFGAVIINDGASDKLVWSLQALNSPTNEETLTQFFDLILYVEAGHSVKIQSSSTNCIMKGAFRQIAALDGTLVNP
jgi:hypothetical protein